VSYPSDTFEDPPQWSRDTDLPEFRWKVLQKELRIQELAFKLEFDRALRELSSNSGWKAIVDRLRSIEHDETQKLRTSRMDSYELGHRQGLLTALQSMTRDKPMEQADIDNTVAEISLLQQQRTELLERVLK
jgi:hypothetical protein